jgi:peroxiredoxin/uncharacterized membrane protein YphA (DoxX/SURF4 family)
MEIVLLVLRIVLFAILFIAGIGKLLDLKGSQKAIEGFGVPNKLAKPFAVALPLAEITISILLLFVSTSWFGAIGASLLLLIFIGGMLWQMKKGNAPDCHCFGQIHSEPVGKKSLFRNVIFILLSLLLVISGQENQGLTISTLVNDFADIMQLILGIVIIGFLFVLLLYLKDVLAVQTKILRRLEILEIIVNEGQEIARDDVTTPSEGLPIGSPVPQFELPNLNGKEISVRDLINRGKPVLFFYVSPTCQPCEALLPEIAGWENELGEKINFVFISNGSAKDNLAKFNSETNREILLQKDREIADVLKTQWTPTAILINAKGMIASHPMAGDVAIRGLLEKIKSQNLDDEFLYVNSNESNENDIKIGQDIPEFELNDIKGKTLSAKDFKGKKTIVTFWSMTCPFCVDMMEELKDWEKVKGQDEPDLIVFSDGDPEAHEGLDLNSSVILDKDYKTAEKFGMNGTPSAVLINENGKIVSEIAIGAGQIWALLGKKK